MIPTAENLPTEAPTAFADNAEYVSSRFVLAFLSARFGVHMSPRKWHRLHAKREGPARVCIGRTISYRVADLKAWVDGHLERARPLRGRR
jgi:hypothetical protein